MKPAVRDQRKAELAAIHVGKARLALDDDTYRAMLWTIARVRSAADLDHQGRHAVLEHMRARGFEKKSTPAPASADHGRRPAFSDDKRALGDKIEALLTEAGYPWNYARSMAKRMFKLDALEFATPAQLHSVVAALEYDKQRRNRRKG